MQKKIFIISIISISIVLIIVCFLGNFKKKEEDISSKPYFPSTNDYEIIEKDMSLGLTIRDKFNNEWVWIVVPRKKVFKTAKSSKDYKKIYNDIKKYTAEYSSLDYDDLDNYEEVKKETLANIYTYGGFWISRYEIGTNILRKASDELSEAVSQANMYVYNNVEFKDAIKLSKQISSSQYKSSLLFGFQWDLICKFIEENAYIDGEKISKNMILSNSSKWGNYYSSSFKVDRGKYSLDYGVTYEDVTENFEKRAYQNMLLTTGAAECNKVLNIYDFAGNVSEFTLEQNKESSMTVIRDGSFYFNYGGNDPVTGRYLIDKESNDSNYGFRIAIINFN